MKSTQSKITIVIYFIVIFILAGFIYAYVQFGEKKNEIAADKVNVNIDQVGVLPSGENVQGNLPIEQNNFPNKTLIQKCPEAWYANKMPAVKVKGQTTEVNEYLIIDSKRVELFEADLEWIRANCQIKKQDVY